MEVKVVDQFEAFMQLKAPWNELSARSPDDHAFMRHEWFEHWLASQEMTTHLHMITAWQDGQLAGVLPLVWKHVSFRALRFAALRFAESAISPRCNAMAPDADVLETLVMRLAEERRCQLIDLQHLEADSSTTKRLIECLRMKSPFVVHVSPGRRSPYLTLNGNWDKYLSSLTSRRRKWIKNSCDKRLAESGMPHEIRYVSGSADYDFLLESMLTISGRSWKAEAGTSIAQVPSQRQFYTEFTPIGLAQGLVAALVLTMGGKPVAFDYYLRHGRRYSEIRSAYDRDYAQYRPGENLRIAFIRHLTQSSEPAELDFGGEASDYKMQWANQVRNHMIIHAARPFSKGALVVLWKKAMGALPRKSAKG